jgi:excisionase family DNA binding protein
MPSCTHIPTTEEVLESRHAIDLATGAQYLGCSIDFLRKQIALGKLAAHRVGSKTIRVYLSDLEKLKQPVVPTESQRRWAGATKGSAATYSASAGRAVPHE